MQKNYIINGYELDNNQMKLLKNDTNTIVVAGAGSGKTLTILGKVNFLIEKENIKPENILLISFTNASVNDIKNRIKYNVNILTFHKLAMYILEKNNVNYTICNTTLLKYIIQEYLKTCSKKEQKIILKFLKFNYSFSNFLKSLHYIHFCSLIETFINFYKTNNLNYNDISSIKYSSLEKELLIIIFNIYKIYECEKYSTNTLDFDDLINYATLYVSKKRLNFKYIIIDEFQDTSFIRLNLIRNLCHNEDSKIIVVGDDWQSIFHFSGCDLNIFLNFSNLFPNVLEIKLLNTYRNSQELIDIASYFIQKNPKQIKKNLFSKKHTKNPIILVPYTNKLDSLKKVLNHLLSISTNILIISRNNKDIYQYLDNEIKFNNGKIFYQNHIIPFLTVHKSKGLEAEYTIILNCNDDYLGFPNKIENNNIINKLFDNEKIPFAEERRLFYVALTRCKEKTYILYNKNNPSKFIKELKKIIKLFLGKIFYFK